VAQGSWRFALDTWAFLTWLDSLPSRQVFLFCIALIDVAEVTRLVANKGTLDGSGVAMELEWRAACDAEYYNVYCETNRSFLGRSYSVYPGMCGYFSHL
jgi:hypothetical protein